MAKPNFFIVGAPRCATTSIYEYLKKHPDIYMSPDKEPCYFAKDLPNYVTYKTLDDYMKLFEGVKHEKCIGEASVWYLYSESAAKEIYDYNPDAKIIIMLRNPVDFLYSLHSVHLSRGYENISDFQEALEKEAMRQKGKCIPTACKEPALLFYHEIARFSEQIKRYYKYFNKKRVFVIIYDDIMTRSTETVKSTLCFLNVRDDIDLNLDHANQNINVRNRIMASLICWRWKNHKSLFYRYVAYLYKIVFSSKVFRQKLDSKMNNLAFNRQHRRELDPEVRSNLSKAFLAEIEKLEGLIERDLSAWKE